LILGAAKPSLGDPSLAFSTLENLRNNYLADDRPWVVAYSGGKDSTLVLQLVYELLLSLGEAAKKPVHIVSSDTRVEAPNVEDYLVRNVSAIQEHAQRSGLPVTVHLVQPAPQEGFWFNLIGKGYPPPTRNFRWCTTKMKIKPAKRVIEEITKKAGSVVLLLGTRISESSQRGQRMEARETNSRGLNPHHEIPNALVFTPISEWDTEEVWDYLFSHNPPPWGVRHDFMLELYRQAGGGECPVVLDLNTPSCGGSRFGCWTCTVVKEDRSMLGFLESGETWMRPLNEFRQKLKQWRELSEMRMEVRRDGRWGPGPFTLEARKKILAELLDTEARVKRQLVSDEELAHIQDQWASDFGVGVSAQQIAQCYDRAIRSSGKVAIVTSKDKELLSQLAGESELQEQWIEDLLYLVEEKYPSLDARGVRPSLAADIKKIVEGAVSQQTVADSVP
jgi:DNA sulfur modification protein DndC